MNKFNLNDRCKYLLVWHNQNSYACRLDRKEKIEDKSPVDLEKCGENCPYYTPEKIESITIGSEVLYENRN